MHALRRITKPVSYLVLSGFMMLSLHVPAANAALIGTDAVVSAATGDAARAKLRAALERDDVKQALAERGANLADLQARVDSLTDQEVAQLSAKLDQLPAGGDVLGVLVFIFLVLLITDILGYTDIFPFVKKPAKK
jgi:hypothetical protein